MRSHLFLLCCALFLTFAASAEELWVRNKPFEGAVEGSGAALKVELPALMQALNLEATIEDGAVVFGDFRVPIETTADGKQMVLLKDLSVGANLKLTRNRELGTIDVYSSTAGLKSADLSSPTGGAGTSSSSKFSINVPPPLELVDDPNVVASLVREMGGLPNGNLHCLLVPKNKQEEAVVMIFSFPATEAGAWKARGPEALGQSMERSGAQRLSGPTKVNIGSLPYYRFQHAMVRNGRPMVAETYWCLQGPRNEAWLAMYIAGQSNYQSSAPPFQQAIQTLVLK